MARGLLISYAGLPVMPSSFYPDNGLASLAGTLMNRGHEVKVLDLNTVSTLKRSVPASFTARLKELHSCLYEAPEERGSRELAEIASSIEETLKGTYTELSELLTLEIESQRSDFLGFKLWSGDGFIASVEIANRLKHLFPSLKIYGGGPAVLYSDDAIYDYTDVFDALVDGEGELSIAGLASYAEGRADLSSVPNLIVKRGGTVFRTPRTFARDLDDLQRACYDPTVYPSLDGDEHIKLFILDESRGCPRHCAFCNHGKASGATSRVKSVERLLEDVEDVRRRFRCARFRFSGSNTPPRLLATLSENILSSGAKAAFSGFTHVSGLDREKIELLASAGCSSLFFGIESFSPKDSTVLNKKSDPNRDKEIVRDCIDAGLRPVVSLIVPLPHQGAEGYSINRDAVIELCSDGLACVVTQFPALLPRTLWWQRPERYGFELRTSKDNYKRMLATYRIRHLLPPPLWAPLSYFVDGNDFRWYTSKNAMFQREAAMNGAIVNLSDDCVLLADLFEEDLRQFRHEIALAFFSLDAEAIAHMVTEANGRLAA